MMSADLDLLVFRNIHQFSKYLDEKIMEIERKLGEVSALLENVKAKRARYERIRKMIEEVSGVGPGAALSTTLNISGLRIVIDPKPIEEYEILENVYKALTDKLNVLRKIKEIVVNYLEKYLDEEALNVIVEMRADIPVRILIKT